MPQHSLFGLVYWLSQYTPNRWGPPNTNLRRRLVERIANTRLSPYFPNRLDDPTLNLPSFTPNRSPLFLFRFPPSSELLPCFIAFSQYYFLPFSADLLPRLFSFLFRPICSQFLPICVIAMGEQNKGVQSGASTCMAKMVECASDPPLPAFQKLCPRICKLLNNQNFMAKASLLPVVASLSQVGAIAPQSLEALQLSIHECLGSTDWATRKAAADSLSALALHSSNLIADRASSTITILEGCRFDRMKPVRDSMTEALQLWKKIAGKGEDGAADDLKALSHDGDNAQSAESSEKNGSKDPSAGDKKTQTSDSVSEGKETRNKGTLPCNAMQCNVWTSWSNAMHALQVGDMDSAYAEVLSTGDDLLLIKLMDRSGPMVDQLSNEIANEALHAIVQFLMEQDLFDICLSWIQQLVKVVIENGHDALGITMELKKELLLNLHEAASTMDPPENWEGAVPDQLLLQLASAWKIELQQFDK
ncbi:hypothetical protein ES288_A09G079700v1 [Gossypium darwinii]|uniref:TOG domain-containing protein n=1 Tax=Gossypium darwinii TaxID=34276 RepID=A0A5D2F6F8_GOSDA|nr:hypothetical protein ES288_A09G079700v1 [Gossypium darwinii]